MRVVVIFKEATDYGRQVNDFLHDFSRQTPAGISFCEAYDIMEYPTVIALSDDGQMQNTWRGLPLPTISEVSYYA